MSAETSTAVREPATVDLRDGSPGIIPDQGLTNHDEPDDKPAIDVKSKRPWDDARIARLGFLVGVGYTAKRTARDPLIASTESNVHRQAARFGLSFREANAYGTGLQPDVAARFDLAAQKRWTTREGLIKLVLTIAAREPNLLDNILDDER